MLRLALTPQEHRSEVPWGVSKYRPNGPSPQNDEYKTVLLDIVIGMFINIPRSYFIMEDYTFQKP